MKNKKTLFITPFVPLGDSGDSFISSGVLKGLAKLSKNLTVIAFKEKNYDNDVANQFKLKTVNWKYKTLSSLGKLKLLFSFKPFLVTKFFEQKFLNQIQTEIEKNNYDNIIIHGYVMVQYAQYLIGNQVIYLEDEDMSQIFWARFCGEKNILTKFFLLSEFVKATIYQKYFFQNFRQIWLLNEKNINSYFAEKTKKLKLPFLVDRKTNVFSVKSKDIVFTGTLDWEENIRGLSWFLKKIWPKLVNKNRVNFHIIGRGASPELKTLIKSSKNVIEHGFVNDLTTIYHKSALAIAPIFVNFGVKVKVLNYLQYGLPVIAFPEATSGLFSKKGVVIASNKDFASKINELLRDNKKRLNLSKGASANIKNFYSLNSLIRFLKENL
ncbi:MAG: glycosyltransferase [Patescibacteria group bacterium]